MWFLAVVPLLYFCMRDSNIPLKQCGTSSSVARMYVYHLSPPSHEAEYSWVYFGQIPENDTREGALVDNDGIKAS